ncbi:MAG: exo-alpha-sialidase [Ruminococcaceae bacterium]|nr:exo-alpha-sialidase [Oscillospiraceae bacterium]
MRKVMRTLSIAIVFLVAVSMVATAFAANSVTGQSAAEALHDLGLLAGKGTNSDGSVNFDTEGSLTRAESITQVVRFLGKEKEATEKANAHPFTDLPTWAVPYVSYAYANGVTKGVSDTAFDASGAMSDFAFLTAILRVLGYNDSKGDFVWNNPYDLAKEVGLVASTEKDATFTRGDAFVICFNALTAKNKDGGDNIAEKLVKEGLFTMDKYKEIVLGEDGKTSEKPSVTPPVKPTDKPEDKPTDENKTELLAINQLEQKSENGDHAKEDYRSASLEINFRETVVLNSSTTTYSRYNKAYYPRVKKVNDNLYLLLYMYDELGPHLYYATSKDGVNWNAPEVLYNEAEHRFTHTYGQLEGKNDSYWAVNADACVLDDGTVLCVYGRRASSGYRYYPELCGLYMTIGTPDNNGGISWSEAKRIYTGQVWEPGVLKRSDGEIQVYFTQVGPDIVKYGYNETHRSTGTAMIVSKDNGKTWTPDIQPGDTNYYHAYTVYQEYVGDLLDQYSGEERPHFNGQMPVAVELHNGRTLLSVETKQLDGKFRVSYAVSGENGYWKEIGEEEESEHIKLTIPPTSSPYVDRFLSGEVYMTHNTGGSLSGRLGDPDGSEFGNTFDAAPGATGIWGSCAVVDTHRAITAMQTTVGGVKGINLYYSYLNHRINSPKKTITVDGYTNDWDGNTDALFVGSESQAQVTLRTAYDDENLYFLISRLDYYLTDGDTVTVCVGAGKTSDYRITVNLAGDVTVDYYSNGAKKSSSTLDKAVVKLFGTLNNNEDKDEGAVIELAVPRAAVGMNEKVEYPVRLELNNQDGTGSVSDTFHGASAFATRLWPKVVLD